MSNKMKNTYLNDYNFNREVGFTSKSELCEMIYDRYAENKEKINCKNFYHQHFNTNIPLYTPMKKVDFVGDVILSSNYSPKTPIVINDVTNVNLNGKKITAPIFSESNGEVLEGDSDSYGFWVKEGELTIEGDGEVVAQKAKYSMAVWANGGKVTIKGGKFYNNGDNSDLIYASNGSLVEIYGGEFYANKNEGASGTKNDYPALNIKDKDRKNTSILVYGGKFYGFNPADNVSEGADTNFVAKGYKSIEIEPNVWEVVKE